jgi:ferredoxin
MNESRTHAATLTVTLKRSGITLRVEPGESILDAIRDAGVTVRASCEMGTCGACEVRVLAGVPDHCDAVLSPQERRRGEVMMICCSGALTDHLTLDL